MKFKKKPVIVDAVQWRRENFPMGDYWQGTDSTGVEWTVMEKRVRTLEGFMRVTDGVWIVTGVMGEKYPVQDAIFKETYEPVEEEKPIVQE
jgi:hypothetical protein